MKKIIFMLACILCGVAGNAESILPAGTMVPLETTTFMKSGDVTYGETVEFKVRRAVKIGNEVVIPANTIARGQVTKMKKSGMLGSEGELSIKPTELVLNNGTIIPLTGGQLNQEGKNKLVLSLFLCWFIKGGQAEIPASTPVEAYTSQDVNL